MQTGEETVEWDTQRKDLNGKRQVQVVCPICHAPRWASLSQVRFGIKAGRWSGRCYEHKNAKPVQFCSIDGCGRSIYGKGWCGLHWRRWYRTGDPLKVRPPTANAGSFKKGQAAHNKGVPRTEEQRRRHSEALKGRPSWNKGKPWPEEYLAKRRGEKRSAETRALIREARGRQIITADHRQAISRGLSGRTLSAEHVAKISGPVHYRYKGALTRNLSSKAWRAVREVVLDRDARHCQECGEANPDKLGHTPHHRVPGWRARHSRQPDHLVPGMPRSTPFHEGHLERHLHR